MDVTNSEPFNAQTLSLAHHTLQFFEAGTSTLSRKSRLASLLRQDPALLANFLDTVSKHPPVVPHPNNGDDWLTRLLDALSDAALQQFAIAASLPWLTLDITEPQWMVLRDLHYRSRYVSEIARQLAQRAEGVDPDEAALAGAMHNLGKLMLFSQSPTRFLSTRSPVLLGGEALDGERKLWGTDHITLASERIAHWPLDSYLHDAVRFLYQEPEQYYSATGLVRLLFCAELLSREEDPQAATVKQVCDLLKISETDLDSALLHGQDAVRRFKWGQLDDKTFRAREHEAVVALRGAIGSLASRQIARAELYASQDEDALLHGTARQLRRFFGDALIFTLTDDRRQLVGRPDTDQPQRLADMQARYQPGDNLLAHALMENEVTCSLQAEAFALSMLDKQLQSLVGGAGFCCLPIRHGQTPLGVAVVQLADTDQQSLVDHPQVRGALTDLARLQAANRTPAAADRTRDSSGLVREMYHELSNPLSVIRNHLYVLKRNSDENERATLTRVEEEIDRISDLLSQYRQRAQNRQQASQALDINQLVREIVARVANKQGETRSIETQLDENLRPVITNRLAIHQILTNLLNNALEATQSQNHVTVTTAGGLRMGDQTFIELCVTDDGPGLPDEVMDNLFQPVASTKGGNHSGLGLNIVKSLADEIDVTVQCQSGHTGTRFQVLIPYQKAVSDNSESTHHDNDARHSLPEL